jgi:hypothetical protein
MGFKKITTGFVIQTFDDNGDCTNQEFVAGDQVEYEDIDGEPFDVPADHYQPFEMIQPKETVV